MQLACVVGRKFLNCERVRREKAPTMGLEERIASRLGLFSFEPAKKSVAVKSFVRLKNCAVRWVANSVNPVREVRDH